MDFFVFISEQWLLVSVLLVLVYLLAWSERGKSGVAINYHELIRLANADQAVLLDIRDNKDFKEGHIVDAINIPHTKVTERHAELQKHKDKIAVVVVDKMGQHAGSVGKILSKEGYDVKRLIGGMSEWTSQNLPVVK